MKNPCWFFCLCLKYNIIYNLAGGEDHQAARHLKVASTTFAWRLPVASASGRTSFCALVKIWISLWFFHYKVRWMRLLSLPWCYSMYWKRRQSHLSSLAHSFLHFCWGLYCKGVYKCMFPSLFFLFPGQSYIKLIEQLAQWGAPLSSVAPTPLWATQSRV